MAHAGVPQRSYTEEEVERGLMHTALCGGNVRLASARLEAMGHPVPYKTLDGWMRHWHPDRYARIREQQAPLIAKRIADEAEDFALELAQGERKALEVFTAKADDMKAVEAAAAGRNLTTMKALNIDRIASPLRGRPTVVIEHRNADDLIAKLRRSKVIEGTATEVEEDVPKTLMAG